MCVMFTHKPLKAGSAQCSTEYIDLGVRTSALLSSVFNPAAIAALTDASTITITCSGRGCICAKECQGMTNLKKQNQQARKYKHNYDRTDSADTTTQQTQKPTNNKTHFSLYSKDLNGFISKIM